MKRDQALPETLDLKPSLAQKSCPVILPNRISVSDPEGRGEGRGWHKDHTPKTTTTTTTDRRERLSGRSRWPTFCCTTRAPRPFATLCRLVLAEKNLTFRKRDVSYYNWNQEHLEPFYAHVNPKMQIPAMTVTSESGDKTTLTDSRDILVGLPNIPAPSSRTVPRALTAPPTLSLSSHAGVPGERLGFGQVAGGPEEEARDVGLRGLLLRAEVHAAFHAQLQGEPARCADDGQGRPGEDLGQAELLSKQYPELEQTYLDKREAMKKCWSPATPPPVPRRRDPLVVGADAAPSPTALRHRRLHRQRGPGPGEQEEG